MMVGQYNSGVCCRTVVVWNDGLRLSDMDINGGIGAITNTGYAVPADGS